MARTKTHDENQKSIVWLDDSVKPVPKGPPQVRGRQQIINDPAAREYGANVLSDLRKAMRMPHVNSNQELMGRIDRYFDIVQNRRVPPSVEEMALYCGYSVATLNDWKTGKNHGFSDRPEPGLTTSEIIKKAFDLIHAYHANMAQIGQENTLVYIFRAKCYHGMVEKQEISISPENNGLRPPLTPEEIARNLPELDYTENLPSAFDMEGGGADDAGR